jgi:hypothetical protein
MASVAAAVVGWSGCARGGGSPETAPPDPTGFAALQARGQEAMGVDQYTSTHYFDALPDGGRIELQRDVDDPAGVAQIREHLHDIADAFENGDFSTPAFVHMQSVPGAEVMAEKRDAITYQVRDLPRGAELRITTRDPEAIAAIHEFMAFQRQDHRAGGVENRAEDHAPMPGSAGMGMHAAMHGSGGAGGHAAMHGSGDSGGHAAMHGSGDAGGRAAMHGSGDSEGHAAMLGHAGDDPASAADMQLVHALLGSHDAIQRTVTDLPNGVRAVTESQDPLVAAYIKEHVGSMMRRLEQGEVFNVASSTIPVIFANADRIRTEIQESENGVVFTQTTDVPELVPVLQAHADEVSELVREGMEALMRSMMDPGTTTRPGGPRP